MIDADTTPIVIPFVHTGMQEIMPIGTHFLKIGKKVHKLLDLLSALPAILTLCNVFHLTELLKHNDTTLIAIIFFSLSISRLHFQTRVTCR